jgi:hypothetical protein
VKEVDIEKPVEVEVVVDDEHDEESASKNWNARYAYFALAIIFIIRIATQW